MILRSSHKKLFNFVLAVFIISLTACGNNSNTVSVHAPIIGGRLVESHESIAQRSVGLKVYNTPDDWMYCSGSILASDIILTAAHCIDGFSRIEIFFGLDETKDNGLIKRIDASDKASLYQRWGKNRTDIGLLKFEGGLPEGFESNVLLENDVELKTGDVVISAGYGRTTAMDQTEPHWGRLRVAENVVIKHPKFISSQVYVDQSTQPGGHGLCSGDSGGPTFIMHNGLLKLWGINLMVSKPTCDDGGYIVDLRQHLDWIHENMNLLRAR